MTEPYIEALPFYRTTRGRVLLGLLAVAVPLLYFAARSYRTFSQSYGEGAATGAPIALQIVNPQPGSQFTLDAGVVVQALASGPAPVSKIEFFANGELLAQQVAPSEEGLLNFHADFFWHASELGPHSFIVRASAPNGSSTISGPLFVQVVSEEDFDPEAAQQNYVDPGPSVPAEALAEISAPASGAPYMGPEHQSMVEEIPPAAPASSPPANPGQSPAPLPWQPSPWNWLIQVFNFAQVPPAPPTITEAQLVGCRPQIRFDDKSSNELGFHILRNDPQSANFVKVLSIGAQEGGFAIFTEDSNLSAGTYHYAVAAFNGAGEAISNIQQVVVSAQDCPPKIESLVQLDLQSLFADSGVDQGYCYGSLNGVDWQRLPAVDFVKPGEENPQVDTEMLSLGDLSSGELPALELDCWGWNGPELGKVGDFVLSDIFAPEFPVLSPLVVPDYIDLHAAAQIAGEIKVPQWDGGLPVPMISLGSGPEACAEHAGGNPFFILVCADIADDLDYITWELQEPCANEPFCLQPTGYNIYDSLHNGGKTPAHTANDPISMYFMINGQSCSPRHVYVTAIYEENGQIRESFPSNTLFYEGNPNCGFVLGLEPRTYRLTLNTLYFSEIDDGVDLDDDAEGYGYAMLRLEGNRGAGFATSGSTIDYKIFTDEIEDNPEFFADLFLRYCNLPTPCLFNDSYKRLDKHTTEFTLLRGQWGTVEFSFWDWDEPPIGYDSEQIICQPAGKYWFNSYSIDAAPDQRVSPVLHASHPSGTCEVNFTIELVEE